MTMKADLMARLLKGWTTPIDALNDCKCFSLAQRVSEWRADRSYMSAIPHERVTKPPPLILDKWVDLPNGKRVKAYRAIK
jgi:hypothetical protein